MATKTADSKGRVTLGKAFAGRTFTIRKTKRGRYLIVPMRMIPEDEAWLYQNSDALNSVRRGLAKAKAGQFADGPDLDADSAFADSIGE